MCIKLNIFSLLQCVTRKIYYYEDDDKSCFLNEEQVSGASLSGRDVATLKSPRIEAMATVSKSINKRFKKRFGCKVSKVS